MPEYRRNHPITSALRGWYYAAYADEPQRKHHHRSRFKSLQVINASFSKSKQRNHSSEANGNHSSQGNDMTIHNSLSELIGNTPLVKLNHVTDGIKATIAVKVEYFNPGGSSKDRIAERIIDAAERSGELKPGGVIVEPTSGNTGVGLALVAQQRGYRTIFTLPDKVSEAKRAVLRAYGAEVVVTPTDAGPDDPRSYYQVAERLAKAIPGGYRPNQYDNPNGPESHYRTTGPEI
jgi:cystathionine beta-synthase